MLGFIIWAAVGCVIIGIGISDLFAKKPVGFWANAETMQVNDVKGYNRAVGILFIVYGLIFVLLGTPLLSEENQVFILLSILGVMLETIVMMAVYAVKITKKYQARK